MKTENTEQLLNTLEIEEIQLLVSIVNKYSREMPAVNEKSLKFIKFDYLVLIMLKAVNANCLSSAGEMLMNNIIFSIEI
tara:strand:- start:28847 stop:29083 length:237 start_codon:yes stop_codon:yes gene_type:complete